VYIQFRPRNQIGARRNVPQNQARRVTPIAQTSSQLRRAAPAANQLRRAAPAVNQLRRAAPAVNQLRRAAPAVNQLRRAAPAANQLRRAAPAAASASRPPSQPAVTFAVIARTQAIEGPYTNEFVDWYVNHLGFDRVYLVVDGSEVKRVQSFIDGKGLAKRCSVLRSPVPREKQNAVHTYFPKLIATHIRETWTLHVDSDELLMLTRPRMKIRDLVVPLMAAPKRINHIVFSWITVSSNQTYSPSMTALLHDPATAFAKALGSARKTMAVTRNIRSVSWHTMGVHDSRMMAFPPDPAAHPVVVHFNVRSQTHTILKAVEQKMHSKSRTDLQKLKTLLHAPIDHLSTHERLSLCAPRMLIHLSETICGRAHSIWKPEYSSRMPVSRFRADEGTLRRQFMDVLRRSVGWEEACDEEALHRSLDMALTPTQPMLTLFTNPYLPPIKRIARRAVLLEKALAYS